MWPSRSGAWASTMPHGSTIIERPPECWPRGVRADLVGRDHERLVLDRPRAHERLPVVARGRQGEGGRERDDARAAHGEDPVELGKAQVVADRHAQLDAAGGAREHDLLARLLELRLAVDAPVHLDVEHVDLAVDGAISPSGSTCTEVFASFSWPGTRSTIEPATRSTPSSRASSRAHAIAGPSSGSAAARSSSLGAHRRPLLGQYDQLAPVGGGGAGEAIGGGEVRRRSAVELSWTAATLKASPPAASHRAVPQREPKID